MLYRNMKTCEVCKMCMTGSEGILYAQYSQIITQNTCELKWRHHSSPYVDWF